METMLDHDGIVRMVKPDSDLTVLYTTADLAKVLRLSTKTVIDYIEKDIIPMPIKLRRGYRWMKTDIDQWLADGGLSQ